MAEATDVVRTHRVEIIDNEGRVRLLLGLVGRGADEMWGVVVRNERGRDRAWLATDGPAAVVGFDHAGNLVASLGVDEDGMPDLYLAG